MKNKECSFVNKNSHIFPVGRNASNKI